MEQKRYNPLEKCTAGHSRNLQTTQMFTHTIVGLPKQMSDPRLSQQHG